MTSAPNPFATEVALTDLSGEQLRARVARAQLYLIEVRSAAGAAEVAAKDKRDHLAYLHKLETEGRLYGSGPVDPGPDQQPYELVIVAAGSREEAENIAANDPLQKAGLGTSTVRSHIMNEGVACYVGRALSKRSEARPEPFDPDISGITLSYEALAGRAAGVKLHLISLEPTDKPRSPDDTSTMDAHFVWLRENEMAARLMSCGPVQPAQPLADGVWGGGLGIVATSRAEAERIAAVEPSGREGYRNLLVSDWTLDYGLAAPIGQALVALNQLSTD